MAKTMMFFTVLFFLAYGLASNSDFKTIASGIAVFIVGMLFMEDGFKLFTGGVLEKILRKTTNTVLKSIFSGFIVTAVIQSSSLTSVIAISFLSAELVSLSQAIGLIFGANIGTTATAWIVSSFGVKIKIAVYAMPMLVFGVLFIFFKSRTYKGIGNILLGLGFIFLGISFMKDGFESMKGGIDLASFAIDGALGVIVYVAVGAVATVIIQSSSATMALIITAVATGQIDYMNSLSLAIGANLGTTVTAVLGSVTSNSNGKRLAVAHFIFNFFTAGFAILFLGILMNLVDFLSSYIGIGTNDIAMKLSLFHTIFNIAGVLLIAPFIGKLVKYLETLFVETGEKRGKPKYLDDEVVQSPGPALVALYKETGHLYDSVSHTIVRALRLKHQEVISNAEMNTVVNRIEEKSYDVNKVYEERIKFLYSDILRFSVMAEANMVEEQRQKVYAIKIVCRDIIETVKDIREIQKNITLYIRSNNQSMKQEYNFLRENIALVLRIIHNARYNLHTDGRLVTLQETKEKYDNLDIVATKRLSVLLRENKINDVMASSLMNDGTYARKITKHLLQSAITMWEQGGVLKADGTED